MIDEFIDPNIARWRDYIAKYLNEYVEIRELETPRWLRSIRRLIHRRGIPVNEIPDAAYNVALWVQATFDYQKLPHRPERPKETPPDV